MDLRQLRYFVAIAETGNVRQAAERVRVAQSALSRHVRALEAELGVRLLDRHARGVSLTGAGERLNLRAVEILCRVDEMRAEIIAAGELPAGAVSVGTSPATSRLLYGRLAERVGEDLPRVVLDLVEGASHWLLEGLDAGRLDLAILVNPEPRASLKLDPLVSEQVYLLAASGDRRLPRGRASVEDLRDLPLVLFPRPAGSRMEFEHAAAAAGFPLSIAHEVQSQDVLRDFVVRGLGYGLLPYSSMRAEQAAKRIKAVAVDGLALTRTLVRREDRPMSPAVAEVAGRIKRIVDALAASGTFG
jgi:LysR family nitrogen assimilation transcriptional regulator